MPAIQVNHAKLFYTEKGSGEQTLFFSHGYTFDNAMFQAQIDQLSDHFRCISYDQRGHGKSEVTEDGYALYNLVDDAIGLIEALELGPVHFVGMSAGSYMAMRTAIKRPDLVSSLVLLATAGDAETEKSLKEFNSMLWVLKYIGWFPVKSAVISKLFHKSYLKDKSRKEEVDKWKKHIVSHDRKAMVPFGKAIFGRDDVLEKLKDIKVPTALIVGEDDEATPPQKSQDMADIMPNSSLYTIAEAAHMAVVEKPEEVTNAIIDFYTKIGMM